MCDKRGRGTGGRERMGGEEGVGICRRGCGGREREGKGVDEGGRE